MPARRKTRKIVKLIKSVNLHKDILALPCEWRDCEFVTDKMDIFMDHVANHLEAEDNECMDANNLMNNLIFECQWRDCGHENTFSSFSELARHVYFHAFHAKLKSIGAALCMKNSLASCLLDSTSRNMIPDLPDRLQCAWNTCQESFDNPELYYVHVAQHSETYPSGNGVSGGCVCHWEGCSTITKSRHRLKEHLRSHTQEKVIACAICGGLFSNSTKLFDHIKRQADADTHHYECSHCNRRCSTERLLRDHMRQHVNHYRCPFCEKTCPNPSSLRTHVHYRHTETREYKCSQCDYWAKSAVDLRRHEDNHSRIWIDCEVEGCTYHARYIWDMRLHCRNVHQGDNPSKYLCHVCGKNYRRALKLTNHLCQKHQFTKPSGHSRFRYKQHDDGFYRLLTIRYESVNMTERTGVKRPDTSAAATAAETNTSPPAAPDYSTAILVQPDCFNDSISTATNVRLRRDENGSLMLLTDDVDVIGPMLPVEAGQSEPIDDHRSSLNDEETYYLSNAIGNAFQVCSSSADQENVEPSMYLLQNSLTSAAVSLDNNWHQQTGNNEMYLVSISPPPPPNNGAKIVSNDDNILQAHILNVFHQDGIGTVLEASDDNSKLTVGFQPGHVSFVDQAQIISVSPDDEQLVDVERVDELNEASAMETET